MTELGPCTAAPYPLLHDNGNGSGINDDVMPVANIGVQAYIGAQHAALEVTQHESCPETETATRYYIGTEPIEGEKAFRNSSE